MMTAFGAAEVGKIAQRRFAHSLSMAAVVQWHLVESNEDDLHANPHR